MGRRDAVCEGAVRQEPLSSPSKPLVAAVGTNPDSDNSTRLGTVRYFNKSGYSWNGLTSGCVYRLIVIVVVIVVTIGGVKAEVAIEQVNSCKAIINGFTYNLVPLMRNDGHPRFVAEGDPSRWNYSFNPCLSFNLPVDPHEGTGDQCHYVAVCQWRRSAEVGEYFSLGIQRSAKFALLRRPVVETFQNNHPSASSNRSDSGCIKKETNNHLQLVTLASVLLSRDVTTETNTASLVSSRNAAITVPASVLVNKASEFVNVATPRDMLRETDLTDEGVSSGLRVRFNVSDQRKIISQGESKMSRSEREERFGSEYAESVDNTGELNEAASGKHESRREGDGRIKQNLEKPESFPVTTLDGRSRVDASMDLSKELRTVTKTNERQDHNDVRHQQKSNIIQKRIPTIVFNGLRTKTRKRVYIYLVCDYNRTNAGDAVLQYINHPSQNKHLELRHRCCCPNGCTEDWLSDKLQQTQVPTTAVDFHHINRSDPSLGLSAAEAKHPSPIDGLPDTRPRYIWLILVINASILVAAVFVAGVCCKKGGMSFVSTGAYGYVPTMHGSRLTMDSTDLDGRYVSAVKLSSPDYRDYGSPNPQSRLPSLENCIIPSGQLEVGQRLGGGLFSDTYLAEWKKRRIAVKRITVRVHQNQLSQTDSRWIEREIHQLSHQRHRNLVSVLGICIETRQPYVLNELIEGDSLKEKINSMEIEQFNWLLRIKLCLQVADGMAFLHSAKNPVLHRDLRCANILIDPYGKAKIVDFGLTRIIQRLRNECDHGSGCHCQKEQSAYPASIRWTAPEILRCPTTHEEEGPGRMVFSTACDVYSFAMVCWEITSYRDPFDDSAEEQVIDLVLQGGRPPVDSLLSVLSPFRELMKACWTPSPDKRPTFKQIAVTLKSIQEVGGRYPGQSKRKRSNSESTNYLRSAFNMSEI